MEVDKEGRFVGEGQHSFLDHRRFHVIVLDDDVLLQELDREQLLRSLSFRQHHLTKHIKIKLSIEIEEKRGGGGGGV